MATGSVAERVRRVERNVLLTAVFIDLPVFDLIPDAIAAFLVIVGLVAIGAVLQVWGDSSLHLPDAEDEARTDESDTDS